MTTGFKWVKQDKHSTDFELIYGSIGLLLFLFFRFVPPEILANYRCPWLQFSTLPCPSCGSTRAFLSLARGELAAGLAMNPFFGALFLAGMAFVLYSIVVVAFRLKRLRLLGISKRGTLMAVALLATLLVASWVFLLYEASEVL